jgi:biopolymer transport protein ExbB/TolQ
MNVTDRLAQRIFQSALLWGGLLSVGFYLSLGFAEKWVNPWLFRALTDRWESYLCVSLFLVGVASLTIRAIDILLQSSVLLKSNGESPQVGEESDSDEPVLMATPDLLLEELKKTNATGSHFYRRLNAAWQMADRDVAANSLDRHLQEAAATDREQMDRHYDLTRFLTWALPAVGSLATVLGIAAAISQLNATTSEELIKGVTAGLSVAFDTFALSLGLSIVLVLYKFVDSQCEYLLISGIDRRVRQELQVHLEETGDRSAGQLEQLRVLTQTMVKATEKLAQQGSQPRQAPFVGAASTAEFDEKKIENAVARAMASALEQQATHGGGAASGGPIDMSGWKPLQQALQQVASYLARQQAKQEDEGEVVQQLINIIDDELKGDRQIGGRPELRMHSGDDAAVSLWK